MEYFQRQEMHQEAMVLSREDKWMGMCVHGFSDGLGVKNPHAKAGDTRDMGSVPGWRRYLGEGNRNSFQYSCLQNPMFRGA